MLKVAINGFGRIGRMVLRSYFEHREKYAFEIVAINDLSPAAGLSLIPTTTGAAKAVGLVLPELHGKLDGTAIRVPTPNVSLIDFTFTCVKEISVQKINTAMIDAAKGTMRGILATNALPPFRRFGLSRYR